MVKCLDLEHVELEDSILCPLCNKEIELGDEAVQLTRGLFDYQLEDFVEIGEAVYFHDDCLARELGIDIPKGGNRNV